MTAARDFSGDYAPGGLTTRAKWRAIGRRGGLASGRKRRALSPGRRQPRRRSREEALSLAYSHKQLTRSKFDRVYEQKFERPEWPAAIAAWERGRDTLWEHYLGCWRLYRARGQHAGTTNGQRGAALSSRGRPRCRRTVQRLNRKLEQLGVGVLSHYRDQGATPGHRDHLVLEIRTPSRQHVTPPPGAGTGTSSLVPAVPSNEPFQAGEEVPPTSSAENEGAASPPGTEEEELEQAICFAELKLGCGWASPLLRANLAELKARQRRLRGDCASARPDRGSPGSDPGGSGG